MECNCWKKTVRRRPGDLWRLQQCNFDASGLTYLGLYALQHRGQESAGIVVSDGHRVAAHKEMGLVSRVFNPDLLSRLQGRIAIGHVRYSTTGSSYLANAQPVMARCSKGILAVAHNGNLVNPDSLRRELEDHGSVFQSTTDSEVIINLIERVFLKAILGLWLGSSLTNAKDIYGLRDPLQPPLPRPDWRRRLYHFFRSFSVWLIHP